MAQIVLVTGKPRIGKTAFAVELIMFDDYYKGRKIFSNVNGLKVPHCQPPEGHSWEDLDVWLQYPENVGSIVLFDEVQNLFPVRPSGSKMPDKVSWLHVHGHSAIDLILITQSPKVIDLNLRELVGKHIHIAANKVGGLTRLEFNEVSMNPTRESRNALSSIHHIRKEVFDYYESAKAHTKHSHVKSRWVTVLIVTACLIPFIFGLVGYIGYGFYKDYKQKANLESSTTQAVSETQSTLTGAVNETVGMLNSQNISMQPEQFIPTMAERPESKPLYDSIRKVQQYERIAGCVKGGKSVCTCYSDQATALKEITQEMCLDYVENGLPFDPFREPVQPKQTDNSVSEISSAQVVQMGGAPLPSLHNGDSDKMAVIQ